MRLVQQHIIKPSDKNYKELERILHLSKNLYNAGLYAVRQHFFQAQHDTSIKYKYLNYFAVNKLFKDTNNIDYRSLNIHAAQQVLQQVDNNFKSFFALWKRKQAGLYDEKIQIPKYLKKDGLNVLTFNNGIANQKSLKEGIFTIPKFKIKINVGQQISSLKNIKAFRLVPKNNYIILEIIYEVQDRDLLKDNKRYLSIDLGINNLASCSSNVIKSFIVNGRPVKSINQYYNKKLSKLQSELSKNTKDKQKSSKKTRNLTLKRNNKIKDYFHKASRYIINQAVSNSINTIVIGYNKNWKQEINLGSKNNQNFVGIPYQTFIKFLTYKASLQGINILIQEESYTSKCSFFDNDFIPTYGINDGLFRPSGNRPKRGLYLTSQGLKVNADLNGSLNILRKKLNVASNDLINPACRGFVVNPVVLNF